MVLPATLLPIHFPVLLALVVMAPVLFLIPSSRQDEGGRAQTTLKAETEYETCPWGRGILIPRSRREASNTGTLSLMEESTQLEWAQPHSHWDTSGTMTIQKCPDSAP